ncbi:MAG TPA: hypothetical protein VFP22_00550 [Candidatus Limnocylindrales bacterium]|nr:hypothetical protein [Candidatus Limnocylindrales bacterium]
MIHFDPPYKGTDKETNFPIIVLGIVSSDHALVINYDGDMDTLPLKRVNVDWRWNPQKRAWFSIDDEE